ncbi:hypothetical protein [Thermococcus kodakarensis]|nr:hypothetical protein [Thermococcus kodakarensis]WCN28513.1 hypothetical protein POG15_02275 [Thermococcus kodakarensis]WCN30809.1 hypothetical protein POG21_02275 [Thermococcus kodakarensis]
MPTSEGFIYVSTGYYGLKPHSLGQCTVEYDPTTQYDRFYLVNSSGAHYIGGYYEYEGQNESLTKILNSISERKTTNPVRGKVEGDSVVFQFKNRTYAIKIREIAPYLWDEKELSNLIAFSRGNDIVIVPAIEMDVIENNFTLNAVPGEKTGTTRIELNFTYKLYLGYPFLLNGSTTGIIEWANTSMDYDQIPWEKLKDMFEKPLYVFYFNETSIIPLPILKVTPDMVLKDFELSPEYGFENLADVYILKDKASSTSPTFNVSEGTHSSLTASSMVSKGSQFNENTELLKEFFLVALIVSMAVMALHRHLRR